MELLTDTGNGLLSPALTPVVEEDLSHSRNPSPTPQPQDENARHTSDKIASEHTIRNVAARHVDDLSAFRSRANSLPTRVIPTHPLNTMNLDGTIDTSLRNVLKLSLEKITELKSAPDALPIRRISPVPEESTVLREVTTSHPAVPESDITRAEEGSALQIPVGTEEKIEESTKSNNTSNRAARALEYAQPRNDEDGHKVEQRPPRPPAWARSISVPYPSSPRNSMPERVKPRRLHSKSAATQGEDKKQGSAMTFAMAQSRSNSRTHSRSNSFDKLTSPKGQPTQLPPLSIPTQLHLELSSERPPPLFTTRSSTANTPYESSKVKFERLLNFFLLPPQLEQLLVFGALTCLDAWLYTFTILPLRFIKAVGILIHWILMTIVSEVKELADFVFLGLGRLWYRHRQKDDISRRNSESYSEQSNLHTNAIPRSEKIVLGNGAAVGKDSFRARFRAKLSRSRPRLHSKPSALQANHKADILEGLLIVCSCTCLMRFDASRMYHAIRGQAAIKLYVIYNVLEVFDRLFAALGQDIMECLFSAETLDRKPNGRSRIGRPFWMFLLALIYTVFHATAFFYQVITLNVAVNSYSNALLTLLMSNQFVEIKGTVFKKIEKENLFQLTCADVVERFQLWLMLLIIVLRNIIELGGLSASSGDYSGPTSSSSSTTGVPFRTFGILPNSFTILPSLFPAQVLGPFLLVLGSEMLVDWVKHAYITKFNALSPKVYGRFLDVLAKDYYSSAFAEQSLTRRLGLPVIPLACLFIRASLQTYHMFLATNVSPPVVSATTSLSTDTESTASPVIAQIDHIFRSALGRSTFGGAASVSSSGLSAWLDWTLDDAIALTTMLVVFLAIYLVLLVFKLSLGAALLRFAKDRYNGMKKRERQSYMQTDTKRLGGYGAVELGDERRKIIYEGDPAGLKAMRDREAKMKEYDGKAKLGDRLDEVDRYSMVAKRIW